MKTGTNKDKSYRVVGTQYLERFNAALGIYDQFITEIGLGGTSVNAYAKASREMGSLSRSFAEGEVINVAVHYQALCDSYKEGLKEDIFQGDAAFRLLSAAKTECDIFFYEFYVKTGKAKASNY